MSGTSATKVHCPNCSKPLISQVALAEGSRFVVKCAHCQRYTRIIATFTVIHKRLLTDIHQQEIIVKEAADQVQQN